MKTYHNIFATHGDMVLARSREEQVKLTASLAKPDAQPVTLGVFQMRNACGGVSGKQHNLERMLAAIGESAKAGVQILACPEMCLPGYFTYVNGSVAEAVVANHSLADVPPTSPAIQALQAAARANRMVLAFGFAEQDQAQYYNAIGVIDADGAWLGTRRKAPLYPWGYETASFTEPGCEARSR